MIAPDRARQERHVVDLDARCGPCREASERSRGARVVSSILGSALLASRERASLRAALVEKGHTLGAYVAKLSWEPLLTGEGTQLDGIVGDAIKASADVVWAVILDTEGVALTSPEVSVNRAAPGVETALATLPKDRPLLETLAALRGRLPLTEVELPVVLGERKIGTLRLALSEAGVRAAAARTVLFVVLVNLGIACALALLVVVTLQRVVVAPLGGEPAYVAEVARRVAEGEVGFEIATRAGDRKSAIVALRDMLARLGEVTGQVRVASSAVASAAGQVAASAQAMSTGTSEQAASVEETTTSLEQMTASITANAAASRTVEEAARKGARASPGSSCGTSTPGGSRTGGRSAGATSRSPCSPTRRRAARARW